MRIAAVALGVAFVTISIEYLGLRTVLANGTNNSQQVVRRGYLIQRMRVITLGISLYYSMLKLELELK